MNDEGVDLLFSGTMRFAKDVIAQFDAGIDVPQRDHLELVGADGTMEVHDPWMSGEAEKPAILIHRDGETKRVATEGPDAYQLQLEDFAAAIEGDRAPLLGRDDAIAQAAAIEALYARPTPVVRWRWSPVGCDRPGYRRGSVTRPAATRPSTAER